MLRCPRVRIPKAAARKRRLAVLRQLASGEGAIDLAGIVSLENAASAHDFGIACGATLPLRLSIRNERSGETEDVLVERPWALIGGDRVCDIRLPHADVSQRHAYLQFVASRVLCCDLGSRTGTHWSSDIRARSWLITGEPIYVGPYSIRISNNDFLLDGSAAPTGAGDSPDPPELRLPRTTLAFINARSRAGRSRISRVKRPVTLVGWSHLCNLRLQHSSVGRVHCSLVWTPSGLWVVDLLCRGGTRVNGKLISVARLAEGDDISVGRFRLRVSYGAKPDVDERPQDEPGASETDSAHSLAVLNGAPAVVAPSFEPQPAPPDESPGMELSIPKHDFPSDAGIGPQLITPSAADLMSYTPVPLALPQGHSLSEAVALSLMQQFSTMQQQLFSHTQQLLAVMAQSFSTAHTKQLDLIREELLRVHEVNRELHELNHKLALARQAAPEAPPSTAPEAPESAESPATLESPAAADAAAVKDTLPEQSTSPAELSPAAPPRPASSRPRQAPRAPKSARSRSRTPQAPAGDAAAGADMHAWLCGRINDLEHERTTRWQKILNILSPAGGSS
jgi:pSer/pThr/pTyr-binding forkhead associated (FHA) protein